MTDEQLAEQLGAGGDGETTIAKEWWGGWQAEKANL